MALPFTNQEFFDLLAAYNAAFWPAAVALWAASALAVVGLFSSRRAYDRWISALLALQWAWSAIAYHIVFFTRINPAAWLFAGLFLLQGALFASSGVIRGTLSFESSRSRWTPISWLLMVYALLYPAINAVEHGSVTRIPTFGLPCPTAIFTAGLLLRTSPPSTFLAVVPIVWSAIGGSAAFLLGVSADYALPVAGVVLVLRPALRCVMRRKTLLVCGIVAPVLFVSMTLFVGMLWDGYSVVSQTPSELSAIGAPTRPLWMLLCAAYTALMVAFGWTVSTSAPNRRLRIAGALVMAQALFGFFWPPMHQRVVLATGGGTLTDSLHLVWAMVSAVLFLFAIGFGAAALGKRFRVYSVATIVILIACGAVTGTYASSVQANLPTPWVGVWERITIAAYMGWVAVLAIALLHMESYDAITTRRDCRTPSRVEGRPRFLRRAGSMTSA